VKTIIFFILAISTFNSNLVFAQTKSDSIATKPFFLGGNIYKQNDRTMSMFKLNKALKTDSEANKEWKMSMKNYYPTIILSLIGGGLTGYYLVANVDNDEKLPMIGLGVGLFGLSIPLQRKFNQHTKKAVNIYNANLK
jgi:hypothetical protein